MRKQIAVGLVCMTAVSGAALADSMKNFLWADTDKNGQVTHEEFIALRALWARQRGSVHNLEQSEKIFLNKDRNKDGELTPEEFLKR